MSADWTSATAGDTSLIRQSLRESWPVEKGEAILEALTSELSPADRPRQVIRVAELLLAIEKHNLRRALKSCKT